MPKKKNRQRKRRPRRRRRNRRRPQSAARRQFSENASMVANPCTGPLIPGFYGTTEGIMSKHKTTHLCPSTNKYGYMLWDPERTSYSAGTTHDFNAVQFMTDAASKRPTNTGVGTARFGDGSCLAVTETERRIVGAAAFIAGTSLSVYRTVGACMRITYTGKLSDLEGRLGKVIGFPADTLLWSGASGAPANVEEIMGMCSDVQRSSLDTQEVIFRPTQSSPHFRDEDSNGVYKIEAGQVTQELADARSRGSSVMGFVWDGIDSSKLQFEFFQIIEWKPDTVAAQVIMPPKRVHEAGYADAVLKYLDDNHPGWQKGARKFGGSLLNFAARTVSGSYGINPLIATGIGTINQNYQMIEGKVDY